MSAAAGFNPLPCTRVYYWAGNLDGEGEVVGNMLENKGEGGKQGLACPRGWMAFCARCALKEYLMSMRQA